MYWAPVQHDLKVDPKDLCKYEAPGHPNKFLADENSSLECKGGKTYNLVLTSANNMHISFVFCPFIKLQPEEV